MNLLGAQTVYIIHKHVSSVTYFWINPGNNISWISTKDCRALFVFEEDDA